MSNSSAAAEQLGDLLAHGTRAALGPVDDLADVDLVGHAPAVNLLGGQKRHGSRAAKDGGTGIEHELDVHVQIARPHRHGHGAQALAAQLKTHTGGPDAVAHGDLNPVQGRDAGHFIATGEEVDPVVNVFLGIAENLAFAGGSRAGVDTHDLLEGHGPQGEGIAVA